MLNVKNVKFNIIESSNPKYVEVVVTYERKNQLNHHYIFLTKQNGLTNKDYLKQAKIQFEEDLKNHRVRAKANSNKRGLVFATSVLAATTIALGSFLTYKLLQPAEGGGGGGGGDDPVVTPYKVSASLIEPAIGWTVKISPETVNPNTEYVGEISMVGAEGDVKEICYLPSQFTSDYGWVKVDNKPFEKFEYKTKEGRTKADFKIPAESVTGNIEIGVRLTNDTPVAPVDIDIDEEHMSIEPISGVMNEEYHGVITLKEQDKALNYSNAVITTGGEQLAIGQDYTIENIGKNAEGLYQYSIKINAGNMINGITIDAPIDDLSMFKIIDKDGGGTKDDDLHATFDFDGIDRLGLSALPLNNKYRVSTSYATFYPNRFNEEIISFTDSKQTITTKENEVVYEYTKFGSTYDNLFIKHDVTFRYQDAKAPTPATYSSHVMMQQMILPHFTIDNVIGEGIFPLNFDDNSLSYRGNDKIEIEEELIPGSGIMMTTTINEIELFYYDNLPLKMKLDASVICSTLSLDMSLSAIIVYNYAIPYDDPIVIPDEYYIPDEAPADSDTSEENWKANFDSFAEQPFSLRYYPFEGQYYYDYFFDDDKSIVVMIDKDSTVSSIDYIGYYQDKTDGNYWRYELGDDGEFHRDEAPVSEQEYLANTGKQYLDLFEELSNDFSKFEYVTPIPTSGSYISIEPILEYNTGDIEISFEEYPTNLGNEHPRLNTINYKDSSGNRYMLSDFCGRGSVNPIVVPDFD